jgi:hypothetical protein
MLFSWGVVFEETTRYSITSFICPCVVLSVGCLRQYTQDLNPWAVLSIGVRGNFSTLLKKDSISTVYLKVYLKVDTGSPDFFEICLTNGIIFCYK